MMVSDYDQHQWQIYECFFFEMQDKQAREKEKFEISKHFNKHYLLPTYLLFPPTLNELLDKSMEKYSH